MEKFGKLFFLQCVLLNISIEMNHLIHQLKDQVNIWVNGNMELICLAYGTFAKTVNILLHMLCTEFLMGRWIIVL